MDIFIKLVVTILTFAAIMIFTYSVFKIPAKEFHKQIAILALVVGSTNFYFKFVINSPYFILAQLVAWVVLMVILRRYPIMYSMIVCIIGAIFISAVDTIVTLSAVGLNLTNVDKLINNSTHYIVFHTIVTVIYLLFSYLLVKLNIGFRFVRMRFSGISVLKNYNYIWAGILVLSVTALQLLANSFNTKSYNFYFIIFMAIILIVCVYNAFIKNKHSVKDRYGDEIK